MPAYYNENNAFAAAWLRELIKAKLIADGDVDERSIKEVQPADIKDYTQCHFFAGIGVWSYSLRNAGFPDNRKVWTGSCPCQPFSAAGKKGGFDDERHLWPDWFRLISECRPDTVFGEQVASKDGLAWFDLVSTDLEGSGYTVGAADLCAAGVGAPHIRQRLYFVGSLDYTANSRRQGTGEYGSGPSLLSARSEQPSAISSTVGNNNNTGLEGYRRSLEEFGSEGRKVEERYRATSGFWYPCDWLPCIDGKVRPVEPGTFPLAHGVKNRVGLLRGYGNSLVAPVAQAFIEAYLEVERDAI